jgi:2',3'-cyclic-nucleotide 2'-phosphodiesterase (5'-nucleotidase family)
MIRYLTILLSACTLVACAPPSEFVITVIGTNDVHGEMLPKDDSGGLVTISGYVSAVREARKEDGGAVLLIDAGDMWQGTLESNLSEGAALVEAYNVMDYTAAALGNHEFDFGPVGPSPIPKSSTDDPRGALKQRATEANFPFLAANLIDQSTGEAVRWPNIQPTTLIDVNGVKVGIIGVMTEWALTSTLAANTVGLAIAPLAPTIEKEARALRESGATVIIVSAHAGGYCTEFDDPADTSSCDLTGELFTVANSLPLGLVDHMFAGHTHGGMAHIVNEISISQGYSRATDFSRVDLIIDQSTGKRTHTNLFAPTPTVEVSDYEGHAFVPDRDIEVIAAQAAARADDMRNERIGIHIETPFVLTRSPESPLGNLYTDGLLASADVDLSMHTTNTSIRANLPAGNLTFGSMYEMSPFDNQLTVIELSGTELRQVVAEQAHRGTVRVGISGMRVHVECTNNNMSVTMQLTSGHEIDDADRVKIAVVNYLALGGDRVFASVMPDGGYELQLDAPLARDAIIDWLRQRGGSISESDFSSDDNPKWNLPVNLDSECRLN